MSNYRIFDFQTNQVVAEAETYEQAEQLFSQHELDEGDHFDIYPRAIDPGTCGCTECLIGQSVALEYASEAHLVDLLRGLLLSNLGGTTIGVRASIMTHNAFATKTVTGVVGTREFEVPEYHVDEVLRRFGL